VHLVVANVKHDRILPHELSMQLERSNPAELYRAPGFVLPLALGFILSAFFVFITVMRRRKDFDVILCQYHPHHLLAPVAILLGRIRGAPVVIRADDTYRDLGVSFGVIPPLYRMVNQINESFIRFSNRFLVATSEASARVKRRLRGKIPPHIIAMSPNGVDSEEFATYRYDKIRSSLGIRSDQRTIVMSGHFAGPQYGCDILLRAMQLLRKNVPDANLFLVGDNTTGSQQSMLDELGLRNYVRTYGPQVPERIIDYVKAADVCIGPLMHTCAIPLKVLEYMACGKPIVTGRRSISKDVAEDGVNCLIVDPVPSAVAEAIANILTDNSLALRLGRNAKMTARRFTWDRVAGDLSRTLNEVLRSYRHRAFRGTFRD
jgi:glycosyltransferase involved in cell wall biosynthesis